MATSWSANQPIAGPPWPLGANNDSASGPCMSPRVRSQVAAPPLGSPPCEPARADGSLHLVREPNQVPHIVQRPEPQPRLEGRQDLVHDRLRLAHGQPPEGDAGPIPQLQDAAQPFGAELQVGPALEDGP